MSGRRLLDLAALVNASRGVAQKHVNLRAQQLDVYNRTSTLARAVRSQTGRVTETIKAASFLTSRLNERAPPWATGTSEGGDGTGQPQGNEPKPSREATEGPSTTQTQSKGGLEQDHFYERSEENSAMDKQPKGKLGVKQEKANRYPLPDGSILPFESDINVPKVDHDLIPRRPRDEVSKAPLENEGFKPASWGASTIPLPSRMPESFENQKAAERQLELQVPSKTADALDVGNADPLEEGHDEDSVYRLSKHTSRALSSLPRVEIPIYTSNIQEGDENLPEGQLNSDLFYSGDGKTPQIPSVGAIPEQQQLPGGINTGFFHSSRVAKLLSGKPQTIKKPVSELKGLKVVLDHTILPSDKGQSTFTVRRFSQDEPTPPTSTLESIADAPNVSSTSQEYTEKLAQDNSDDNSKFDPALEKPVPYELRESKVPSSRLGRLWNYGGLAAGMFGGAISESIRRASGSGGDGSYMLSAGNMDRLVTKLSRMRGAALKLGQMISFQDSKMLPAPIQEILQRVQDRADYMPPSQRDKVLVSNLGTEWRDLFSRFEEKPIAAASIGQVHSAVLKSNGARVAVKVQYPGVADSIDSDLNNLALLLTASRLLPKGLFLDKTIDNARTELAWECDYIREAECGSRFQELLADEKNVFTVPKVFLEASGKQVLTTEFMEGIGVTRIQNFTQEQKDWIGTQILRLCLREITEFKFMQTDPNWTNFLYNAETNKLELLDFGASREYAEVFIMTYAKLLAAASRTDRDTVRSLSIDLGYLTGHESKAMLDAHIASVLTLAEPFLASSPELYDFKDQTITERVKALIPVMIRERLAPPPEETYSLHRKLSGAFLLCARLGSRVRCRELFENSMTKAGIL